MTITSDTSPRLGWRAKRLTQHRRPPRAPAHHDVICAVEPGQVRLLLPPGDGGRHALVLVTASNPKSRTYTVVLLSPDTGFGGDRDLLLGAEDTGLAYDVLVQTEVLSYAWAAQLGAVHGQVSSLWLAAVERLQGDEPSAPEPDLRAGPPIVRRADLRWSFKLAELARLTALTADCCSLLIEGGAVELEAST